jgi:hypothetical protein
MRTRWITMAFQLLVASKRPTIAAPFSLMPMSSLSADEGCRIPNFLFERRRLTYVELASIVAKSLLSQDTNAWRQRPGSCRRVRLVRRQWHCRSPSEPKFRDASGRKEQRAWSSNDRMPCIQPMVINQLVDNLLCARLVSKCRLTGALGSSRPAAAR